MFHGLFYLGIGRFTDHYSCLLTNLFTRYMSVRLIESFRRKKETIDEEDSVALVIIYVRV